LQIAEKAKGPVVKSHRSRQGHRKGKKTRSKQKNMKKDNRPEHLKPTYRTPGSADYKAPKPVWRLTARYHDKDAGPGQQDEGSAI